MYVVRAGRVGVVDESSGRCDPPARPRRGARRAGRWGFGDGQRSRGGTRNSERAAGDRAAMPSKTSCGASPRLSLRAEPDPRHDQLGATRAPAPRHDARCPATVALVALDGRTCRSPTSRAHLAHAVSATGRAVVLDGERDRRHRRRQRACGRRLRAAGRPRRGRQRRASCCSPPAPGPGTGPGASSASQHADRILAATAGGPVPPAARRRSPELHGCDLRRLRGSAPGDLDGWARCASTPLSRTLLRRGRPRRAMRHGRPGGCRARRWASCSLGAERARSRTSAYSRSLPPPGSRSTGSPG